LPVKSPVQKAASGFLAKSWFATSVVVCEAGTVSVGAVVSKNAVPPVALPASSFGSPWK
jgi:hypothetical protein